MARKEKITISCVGENAVGVTGSCIWIKTPHKQILLECGLWQSPGDTLEAYKINNNHFKFKPADIDYVFLNHNHIDHCGRIPQLFERASNADIVVPANSKEIMEILLRDSAKIAEVDASELSKKYGRTYAPIYSDSAVDRCLSHVREYNMGEIIELDEYIKFRFVPSGHILNSAQLELWITEGNITKKIAYTSDLGNIHVRKYYTNEFIPITKADVFIGECTYGGEKKIATQRTKNKDIEKLKAVIYQTCVEQRGRMLIPVFANDRCQNILTHLYELFGNDPSFKIPVLVDSPMAVSISKSYLRLVEGADKEKWESVTQWKNVKFITDPAESKVWQNDESPAIILSSSGMMTHGRSRTWCKALLSDARNTIVFCGFSVSNSLASIIKSGKAKMIKLGGVKRPNRCRIVDMHSFSSHMQRDSLIEYYSNVECSKILLVHGDMGSKIEFTKELQEAISKNNKTSKAICVNKEYSLTL